MKNLFPVLISFTLFSNILFSQSKENIQWEKIYSDQGIVIEKSIQSCTPENGGIDMEEIYLKFTNTTDKLLMVKWQYDVTYGDKCYNCEGGMEEMTQSIKLSPNSFQMGDCADDNRFRLRIFSKFLNIENPSVLTDFHVKDIVVSEIKTDRVK